MVSYPTQKRMQAPYCRLQEHGGAPAHLSKYNFPLGPCLPWLSHIPSFCSCPSSEPLRLLGFFCRWWHGWHLTLVLGSLFPLRGTFDHLGWRGCSTLPFFPIKSPHCRGLEVPASTWNCLHVSSLVHFCRNLVSFVQHCTYPRRWKCASIECSVAVN